MGFSFNFFGTQEVRKFSYKPRFYDPEVPLCLRQAERREVQDYHRLCKRAGAVMSNSGFLDEKPLPDGIERLASQGGTSEAFIVKADGKNLFMKRLRPEFACDTKYRTIFEKEYELGRSIESPYFPEYMLLQKSSPTGIQTYRHLSQQRTSSEAVHQHR